METRRFTDPAITAVFQAHPQKHYNVVPLRLLDGKVGFDVEGPDIDETLKEIYSNISIPILSYLQALKTLRGAIFALKDAHNG